MKKIFVNIFIITIILLFEKTNIFFSLRNKAIKSENEKNINITKYNNLSIISNIKLEQNVIYALNNNIDKMVFNNNSLLMKNKYSLLKLLINKYDEYPYYNNSLFEINFYNYFFELIYFKYTKINNVVLIDINIHLYIEKNAISNNGFLIFIKKYAIIFSNIILLPSNLILNKALSIIKNELNYEKYRDKLMMEIFRDYNYIDIIFIFSNSFVEKEINIYVTEIYNTNYKLYKHLFDLYLEYGQLYKREDLFLNYVNKFKNLQKKLDKQVIYLLKGDIEQVLEYEKYNNEIESLISKLDNKFESAYIEFKSPNIEFDLVLLLLLSILNFIYSENILNSLETELISVDNISSKFYYINCFFHFHILRYYVFIISDSFKEKYYLKGLYSLFISFFSGLNVISGYYIIKYINTKTTKTKDYINYAGLFLINSLLCFKETILYLLTIELIMWIIVNNIIFRTKNKYPIFYIIVFIIEKFQIISFLCKYNNISLKIKYKIIFIKLIIINIIEIVIIYIHDVYIPKFKEELLKEKLESNKNICPICLEPLFNIDKTNNKNYKKIIKFFFKLITIIFIIPNDNEYKVIYSKLSCNHYFHSKCLELWLEYKNNCPICRKEIYEI